jgi:hypothetical protein
LSLDVRNDAVSLSIVLLALSLRNARDVVLLDSPLSLQKLKAELLDTINKNKDALEKDARAKQERAERKNVLALAAARST